MTGDQVTVGERYELDDLLGRGGMAEVRRALDTRLGRQVAVKQLRADLATDPTFQARFRREAQSAAGLNHPNIVAVYDTGEEPDPITGVSIPYIVMELVQGPTLRDILRDGRKILPERALELTQGVLDALSYSHKAGIIHRDIKPANVMLTPTGTVKVMDFGIARAVADTSATMTQTAAVIGTAQYLSPEQARGETVDARSDIYSAGCLLYELLVGRPPFIGESPVSVAYQHVREAPIPPSQLDPVVTPDIDAITLKALAKDPADRYQSAREMRTDISRVLAGQQATAVVPKVNGGAPVGAESIATRVVAPVVATSADVVDDEEDEPRKSRVGLAIFIIGLIVLILGAGSYGLYRMLQPKAPIVQRVTVPSVITYTEEQAKNRLDEVPLKMTVVRVNSDAATKGTVVDQNPKGGIEADANSSVEVTVNDGPKTGKIPTGLKGKDVDDVKAALAKAKFSNVVADPAESDPIDAKANEVISIDPGEGTTVPLDQEITVTYASGKSLAPLMIGKTPALAEAEARQLGFTKFKQVEEQSDQTAGVVFDQFPKAGTMISRGTTITYKVAIPKVTPPPSSTPSETPPPGGSSSASPSGGQSSGG